MSKIKFKNLLIIALSIICARFFFWASITQAASAKQKNVDRPNVVLILADDLGYEVLSSYGGESYDTPHLDRLAAEGIRFTHAYAQPLCTPSRVKLMTGKYNFRNYDKFGLLPADQYTFGHLLNEAGYATAFAGKWQLGPNTPAHFGFDEYVIRESPDYWGPKILENGEQKHLDETVYGPDYYTDFLFDFMERHQDKPFFAYFPTWLTHWPFVSPPNGSRRNTRTTENFSQMVSYLDTLVGRIIRKLEELGVRENTLILFVGDNGTHRSIRSQYRAPWMTVSGKKGFFVDAGTRVPLIANWPEQIPEGQVSDDLVDLSDFLPTLVDVAHTTVPDSEVVDGRSFLPQLRGKEGNPREWVLVYYPEQRQDQFGWPKGYFARTKRYKLYGYYEQEIGRDNDERTVKTGTFYDVKSDPDEDDPIQVSEETARISHIREMLLGVFQKYNLQPSELERTNPNESK